MEKACLVESGGDDENDDGARRTDGREDGLCGEKSDLIWQRRHTRGRAASSWSREGYSEAMIRTGVGVVTVTILLLFIIFGWF